jgi:hypothetical protein
LSLILATGLPELLEKSKWLGTSLSGGTGVLSETTKEVLRFMAPGPWVTRDLKECVLAKDYDQQVDRAEQLAQLLARAYEQIASLRQQHQRGHLIYHCSCEDCRKLIKGDTPKDTLSIRTEDPPPPF